MVWKWTVERDRFVLRPHPAPAGLAEAGFIGRALNAAAPGPLEGRDPVRLEQVHGARVRRAHGPDALDACDAVFSEVPGLVLTVRTADCLPVILGDGRGGAAVVHAGWRGMVGGVIEAAVACFANPEDLIALIGPAIGPCCFEVGPEVAAEFPRATIPGARGQRPHVDLFADAERRLRQAGVSTGNMSPPGPCTRCHQHLLHSHRGSGGAPGRITAYAVAGHAYPQEA